MKTLIQNKLSMAMTIVVSALFVMSLYPSCKKADLQPTTSTTTTPTVTIPKGPQNLDLIGLKTDSGFAYKLSYNFPIPGDTQTAPKQSTLHLFENGVEMGPAHSNHNDIRNYGLGQYSHWGNELIFSTSDNSNPLSNGRKYTYTLN